MKRLIFQIFAIASAALLFAGCSDDKELDAALAVPANVHCSVRGDVSLTFVWDAVDGATNYHYEFADASGATLSSSTVTAATATVSGLKPSTEYRFRVQASRQNESSAYSDYVSASTTAAGEGEKSVLETPEPKQRTVTESSVTVEWEAVPNAAKYGYQVTAENGAEVKSGDVQATEVTVDGLAPATTYKFAVRALAGSSNTFSDSDFSQPLAFTTNTAETPELKVDLKLPANEQDGVIRAFPGAEGAGMYTTGGRGGKVIHVTNLNDSGTGSLRAAIGEKGARTIVFDVAGNIELKSTLKIANGDVTIAGQTAPGDGICIKNYGMEVNADNVIIRFLRIRPGDMAGNDGMDALGGRYMENVIIDHCSMSWSTDECVSFYVNRNMTMQYCLAYESLRNGKHKKGTHGYGGIWGGAPASFHHNILAHHDSRNPRLDSPEQYGDGPTPGATAKSKGINRTDRLLDFRNNVIYNFCNYPAYGGVDITINFVGNYYKWGPASINGAGPNAEGTVQNGKARLYFCSCDTYYDNNGVSDTSEGCVTGNHKIYYGDNSNKLDTSVRNASEGSAVSANNQSGFVAGSTSGAKGSCPFEPVFSSTVYPVLTKGNTNGGKVCDVTTHTADAAFDILMQYCGASLRQDSADLRVLADVKNGTGVSGKSGEKTTAGLPRSWNGLIDSQEDVGGWPVLKATDEEIALVNDTDGDGIPDYYEELLGLNPNDASDAAKKTIDPQHLYTNLEIYLHYLVQDIVEAQNAGGVYTELK